ncbi:MAG: hypothetical protein FWD28_10765 [Treponema sp.]|nr:hypothetical protein [Treponema sp.]
MMRKKWLPHIIAVVSLAAFITLGLASDMESVPSAYDTPQQDSGNRVVADPPRPRQEQVIRREFNTPGNHTFVFGEAFPATIEIYALGAGGGGQGGHTKAYQQGLGTRTESGRGAGGGGGAVAYTRLRADRPITLNITVGTGGAGGGGHSKGVGGSWESGRPGAAGGDTVIRFGSTTITAQGGRGGGGTGDQNVTGGAGGVGQAAAPSGILDWAVGNGDAGTNGRHNSDQGGFVGRAGGLRGAGSEASFGGTTIYGAGGAGAHGNRAGELGSPGQVLIIVRY